MEEHDRQQLAALRQYKRDIVNVFQACVAERRSKGACDGDGEEKGEDLGGGKDGRDAALVCFRGPRCSGPEIEKACAGGEGGLDCVEDDGVGEAEVFGAVGCGRYFLLEVGPA